jgi:hypothetical protein
VRYVQCQVILLLLFVDEVVILVDLLNRRLTELSELMMSMRIMSRRERRTRNGYPSDQDLDPDEYMRDLRDDGHSPAHLRRVFGLVVLMQELDVSGDDLLRVLVLSQAMLEVFDLGFECGNARLGRLAW